MRGGKREGSGRKKLYESVQVRIPTDLKPMVLKMVGDYILKIKTRRD